MNKKVLLGLLLLLLWLAGSAPAALAQCAAPSFPAPRVVTEPDVNYRAVTYGHFNGDGKVDMATGGIASGFNAPVRVYLGDGAGGFAPHGGVQTGDSSGPWSLISHDLNLDGKLDLAAVNFDSVSVMLGDGAGSFAAGVMFAVPARPRAVGVADFNADGRPDLVTANDIASNVSVLLGDGAGSFAAARNFAVAGAPRYLKTGDFNADGRADVVVSSETANGLVTLLGDGAGNLSAPFPRFGHTGRVPAGVDAADFDADGDLDLVVANDGSREVVVWLNDGTGRFASPVALRVGPGPVYVLAPDLDADGRPDLFVTNNEGNSVSVLRGLPGGAFAEERRFVVNREPRHAAVADFNNDGKLDAGVVWFNGLNVTLLQGDGAGGFQAPENFRVIDDDTNASAGASALAPGDYNSDGRVDLVVAVTGGVVMLRGDGAGRFTPTFRAAAPVSGGPRSLASGDFNRDGFLDFAVTGGQFDNRVGVFLGNGAGNFAAALIFPPFGASVPALFVADVDNDGDEDLVGGTTASVLLGDGAGNFVFRTAPAGPQIGVTAVGDFNADGRADVVGNGVFVTPFEFQFGVFLGDGAGNFAPAPGGTQNTRGDLKSSVVGDFNADGRADIAASIAFTGGLSGSGLYVFLGDGAGGLAAPVHTAGPVGVSTTSADFNGDGHTDIAGSTTTLNGFSDNLWVALGNGAGSFGASVSFPVGRTPNAVASADVNGDGRSDLSTANGSRDVTVLLNTCATVPAPLPSVSAGEASVTEGDAGVVNASFNVQLSGPSARPVSVSFHSGGLAAVVGEDLQPVSGRLTFAPGETQKTVTVPVVGDTLDEFDERFSLRLTFPLNANVSAHGQGTVLDDDPAPTVSVADLSFQEGNFELPLVSFGVTLSKASGKPITVSYATADGTAVSGLDYITTAGTLQFAPGETVKTVFVPVRGDTLAEPDETFFLNLSNPGNVTLGDAQAAATVVNDDTSALFTTDTTTVGEGVGVVRVTVLRAGLTTGACAVNYETRGGSASERSDYLSAAGTLRFAPGETEKTFDVFIVNDTYGDANTGGFGDAPFEGFNLMLSAPTGCTLGAPATGEVRIRNDETADGPNPVRNTTNGVPSFDPAFFVRQHYLDFFNREPDAPGLAFWIDQITSCGADAACAEVRKINVSAAFFLSIEFQQTGYLVYRTYAAAFGPTRVGSTVPLTLGEFLPDTQEIGRGLIVGQPGWEAQIEANKQTYFNEFVQRPSFLALYPPSLGPAQFVDALNANTGGSLSQAERDQLVNELTSGAKTRAQVLRAVAEDADLRARESNRAFVLMQYFGYMRRNPNDPLEPGLDFDGYLFWLGKLEEHGGNFVQAEMVKSFITSEEYKLRFGP